MQPWPARCGRIRRLRGDVVKWLNTEVCKTSIQRFESARRLHFPGFALGYADPCRSGGRADAADLKSAARKGV